MRTDSERRKPPEKNNIKGFLGPGKVCDVFEGLGHSRGRLEVESHLKVR